MAGSVPAIANGETTGEVKEEPAVVVTETEPVKEAEVKAAETTETKEEPAPKAEPVAKEDWRERRLAQKTAQLAAAQEELARLKAGQAPVIGEPAPGTPEYEKRIGDVAAQRIAAEAFTRECNEAAAKGRLEFPDFDSKIGALVKLVDAQDPSSIQQYNMFLSAAIETGDAPALLHALGGDLNEASRILSLPPVKMAVELTKLAAKTPAEVSKLPKPIQPIGNRGESRTQIDPTDPERSDNLTTREWMNRREAQLAQKSARH